MDLVEKARPAWTEAQRDGYLEKMMDDALAVGLTGVHDAMVSKADYDMYKRSVLSNLDGRPDRKESSARNPAHAILWYGKWQAVGSIPRHELKTQVFCDDRDLYCGDDFPMLHGEQGEAAPACDEWDRS